MRYLKFIALSILCHTWAYGQSDEVLAKLFNQFTGEQWHQSVATSDSLLKIYDEQTVNDSNHDLTVAHLRYAYLYSIAGLLKQGRISKAEALAKTQGLIGKNLISFQYAVADARSCSSDCIVYGGMKHEKVPASLKIVASSQKQKSAHFVLIVQMEQDMYEGELLDSEGRIARLGGVLASIEVDERTSLRLKATFTEGFIIFADD